MMTFEEFQASGRDVADLRTVDPDAYLSEWSGRVYAGNLIIERAERGWCLTIGNHSAVRMELATLERDLYDYGMSEGIL
jgi:hypothetical protein